MFKISNVAVDSSAIKVMMPEADKELYKDIFLIRQCEITLEYICDTLQAEFGFPELGNGRTSMFFYNKSIVSFDIWLICYARVLAKNIKVSNGDYNLLSDLMNVLPMQWVLKYKHLSDKDSKTADKIIMFIVNTTKILKETAAQTKN